MPINCISKFQFSQYYVQDDGGWCGGISVSIITHLYENLGEGYKYVMPAKAYAETE